MHETLAFLRGCDACPWNAWEVHYESWMFRQRATWHPGATAEPLLAAFIERRPASTSGMPRPTPI